MEQKAKRVADSRTEQVHILMPADSNGTYRMFGGILMQWIDIVAAVVARRHSGSNVTTASVDNLQFLAPAHINDTVILVGRMTYAGRTSMEVCVDTFVEALDGQRRHVNKAYVVMVAVDGQNCPQAVPQLIPETKEEQAEWKAAEIRRENRRLQRQKQ